MKSPVKPETWGTKLLSCVTSVAMVLALVPSPALAEAVEEVTPGGVEKQVDEVSDTGQGDQVDQYVDDGAGSSDVIDSKVVVDETTDQVDETVVVDDVDAADVDTTDDKDVVLRSQAGTVSTWDDLQQAINNAPDDTPTNITLSQDITGGNPSVNELEVPAGKTIELDLNGKTLKNTTSWHGVIINKGHLTITGHGVITNEGGGGHGNGGGINNAEGATLVVENTTIEKCCVGDRGGAIYNEGNLTVSGSTIEENWVKNVNPDGGGGIYNTSKGTMTIENCKIQNNMGGHHGKGGGIYNAGIATITSSNITGNKGSSSEERYALYRGGGIFNSDSGMLTMTGTFVNSNTAYHLGGGVCNSGTFIMESGTINGNTSRYSDSALHLGQTCGGGGIYNTGTVELHSGEISNNVAADRGGGIFHDRGTLTIKDGVTIEGNESAYMFGGGIHVSDAILNLDGGLIQNNKASSYGGGINLPDEATANITGGTVTGNTANEFAGINCQSNALNMSGSPVVKDNTASDGKHNDLYLPEGRMINVVGAFTDGADVSVSRSEGTGIFTSGFSTYNGEALPGNFFHSSSSEIAIYSEQVRGEGYLAKAGNTWASLQALLEDENGPEVITLEQSLKATSSDGPLTVPQGRTVTLKLGNNDLDRNLQKYKDNGGVIVNYGNLTVSGGTITQSGGTITGGKTTGSGGAISNKGTMVLDRIYFIKNNEAKLNGGGIVNYPDAALTIKDVEITANVAGVDGGGIWNMGELTFDGAVVIDYNKAGESGGGIYADEGSEMMLGENFGCVKLLDNRAAGNGGGIVNATNMKLGYDFEFRDNKAGGNGGAIYATQGELELEGPSIKNNTAEGKGGGIYHADGKCMLYGSTEVSGNKAASAGGVYHEEGPLYVGERIKVKNNTADEMGQDLLLARGEKVIVERSLWDGADIGVCLESGNGFVTTRYASTQGGSIAPSRYFTADEDYELFLRDGEVYFREGSTQNRWQELQEKINNAENEATIKLEHDATAVVNDDDDVDKWLTIPEGKTITIDLNGHVLDRGLVGVEGTLPDVEGSVFYVPESSKLTLIDTNEEFEGFITGGFATRGGGVLVKGELFVDGADIVANNANAGGGIYVDSTGTLTLKDGDISANTSVQGGGGISVGGSATINGGKIFGNTALMGGGVYNMGTLAITGGEIAQNEAESNGGGICDVHSASGSLCMSGSPRIVGNMVGANGKGADVYLYGDQVVTVAGPFESDVRIGVALAAGTGIFTSGYGEYNDGVDPSVFFVSDEGLWAYLTDGGEAEFRQADTYQVVIDEAAVGKVSADREWAPKGATVTLYDAEDGAWPYYTYDVNHGPKAAVGKGNHTFTFSMPNAPTNDLVTVFQTYEVSVEKNDLINSLTLENTVSATDESGATHYHQLPGREVRVSFDLEEGATIAELNYTYTRNGEEVTKALDTTFDGQHVTASFDMPQGSAKLNVSAYKTDGPVHYVDAAGGDHTCSEYTPVSALTTSWEHGKWYVVGSDVTIAKNIEATGDVNLILCDGATLTVEGGISACKSGGNGRLTVWCQEGGTGALVANGRNEDQPGIGSGSVTRTGSDIVINGGHITATGGAYAAGIGGRTSDDGSVAIHGGTVEATGGKGGPGIGQGYAKVTIDGGHVNATGGQGAPGVKCATTTLSYEGDDADMSVYASGYEGIVSFEKEFKAAEDGERYAASTTSEDYEGLAGKTLIPGTSYTVTVKETEGGTVTASREVAAAGTEVTLTAEPDEGFELRRLSVKDASGNEVELGDDGTFAMPASDVTVEATFRGEGTPDFDAIEYYMSIALKDSIDVNLYVQKLPEGTEPGDYTVRYRVGDGEERVATLTSMTSNYVNLAALTARQMSEPIRVEVCHVSQDEPIKVVEDCGIRRYCDDKLDNPDTPEKLGALCQAALDYGTMAQVHFKYLTDDLANANHGEGTEAAIAATTVPREYAASGEAPSAEFSQRVRSVSGSVSLESRVTVNLYVEPAAGTTAEDIAVTVGGVEAGTTDAVTRRTLDDGRVLVQVTGIAARNLDKRLEVEVSAGGASRTIGYAPLSYAYSKQGVAKDRLGDTCKALYNYWKTASEYLG